MYRDSESFGFGRTFQHIRNIYAYFYRSPKQKGVITGGAEQLYIFAGQLDVLLYVSENFNPFSGRYQLSCKSITLINPAMVAGNI